jgi:hypothetical protein
LLRRLVIKPKSTKRNAQIRSSPAALICARPEQNHLRLCLIGSARVNPFDDLLQLNAAKPARMKLIADSGDEQTASASPGVITGPLSPPAITLGRYPR